MQELMLGNAAVACGLYQAGCRVVSSYPGTPSTEITEVAGRFSELQATWAPNEKVAAEMAIGAAIGGARAFTAMKHVGLNVAADPLFTSSYTGVNAGLVLAVADDPGMHSSQNEQDSRHYAVAAKLPMLEPASSAECLSYTELAFDLSEQFDTPVLLRLSTRVSHSQSLVEVQERGPVESRPYEKNAAKYVMVPANAQRRHPVVEARQRALAQWAETTEINCIEWGDRKIGIITSGICYAYAKEALPEASFLKLGMVHPLPDGLIEIFAVGVDTLYVIEELDPVIETHCRAMGLEVIGKSIFPLCGEYSQGMIREKIQGEKATSVALDEPLPGRPPVMCAGCPHRPVFHTLSRMGVQVMGDIGCYTLGAAAPLSAMDTTICMGFSVSGLAGFNLAVGAPNRAVAVIGDSTFIHSGITGLINMVYTGGTGTILILDNSITAMTGHQDNPTTGRDLRGDAVPQISLEALCSAVGVRQVQVVDPYDLDALRTAIKGGLEAEEVSVIIARSPCALLRGIEHKLPVVVDDCRGCKVCMKIGCPAMSFSEGRVHVDTTLCVGCGLCAGLCTFGCISAGEVVAL